jgi:hypothetical protein
MVSFIILFVLSIILSAYIYGLANILTSKNTSQTTRIFIVALNVSVILYIFEKTYLGG